MVAKGICRDSRHKRRATGGKRKIHQKKRKFELGRAPAMTKLGVNRVRPVRCMGGNLKFRALRLEIGNFSWATQSKNWIGDPHFFLCAIIDQFFKICKVSVWI